MLAAAAELGAGLGQALKITGPQRLAAQHINAGRQTAAPDRFGIPLQGRGRLKSLLPDGDQRLAELQVAVGAHQIKTNLPLRFSQGGAAAGQARAEGGQLCGLAQGQQVEIQDQPQVAEAVLELGVAVLSKPQADVPQGREAGDHPHRGADLGETAAGQSGELGHPGGDAKPHQGLIAGHSLLAPLQIR